MENQKMEEEDKDKKIDYFYDFYEDLLEESY